MRTLFLLILLAGGAGRLAAQDPWVALNQFLTTPFMREFVNLRTSAERTVSDFKRRQNRYAEEDVQRVIDAYNSSAEYFNTILYNIKRDILIKEKRQYIVAFPEDYSKQVEADLYRAREFFADTFQKEVIELTGEDSGTGSFLSLLPTLLNYAKSGMEIFRKIQEQIKKFNDAFLEKHLIEPYKFRTWDEIQ